MRSGLHTRTSTLAMLILLGAGSHQHSPAAPVFGESYTFTQAPRRIALVIGNGNYRNLPPLPSALNDVAAMAKRLQALDFDVTEIADLPSAEHFFAVDLPLLQNKIQDGDVVLFYFSGHGFAFGKFNYVAPANLPALVKPSDLSDYALPIETIQYQLAARKPGLLIMMLDACRKVPSLQIDDPEKGVQPPKELVEVKQIRSGINVLVGYATKYDSTAAGSAELAPSLFTNHLVLQLKADQREFGSLYKDVIADVRSASSEAQFPGIGEWSASDFYLKPSQQVLDDQRTAWLAALSSERRAPIQRFSMRFATSLHAAAARKWLGDHPLDAPNFTQFSPLAVESAWGENAATIAATTTGLGFPRWQDAVAVGDTLQAGKKSLGVLSYAGGAPRKWDEEVLAMAQQQDVVALKDIEVRRATAAGSGKIKLPFGTSMRILDVERVDEKNAVLLAATPQHGNVVVPIAPAATGTRLTKLGSSLSEVELPPRPDAKDLVDIAPLVAELEKLKASGRTVTWISAATGVTGDTAQAEERLAFLTHAIYSLRTLGIEDSRITAVTNADNYASPGVRLRIFGY